ncbi:MAG: glycosyltransferase family 2 protein [Bacteroidales bacterium]|nr:glycosyltransferase family 2 protein [Bacteroidales bacterium]
MDLSLVISLYNEEESLVELVDWIGRALAGETSPAGGPLSYEILMIDDGSTDGSWKVVTDLSATHPEIRAIRFRRNYGKSAALFEGFAAAEGDIVVTLDADLQDNPEEIPEMMRMIREEGYDLVSGWKKKRYDNVLFKNIPSKIYNRTARRVTGIKLHDMNCGLKAYRKEVVKSIEVYGDMHRYIPYLAKEAGFGRIGEKVVRHQARKYGKSKFGMERFIHGFLDLETIWFLQRFGKKPMHLFGSLGILTFLIGIVIALIIIINKLVCQAHGLDFRPVTDQPLFYLALVAVIVGTQMFLTGFLGELVSRNSQERNNYNVRERIR